MNGIEEQLQGAAPRPTAPLDTGDIRRRARRLGSRRRARQAVGGGLAVVGLVVGTFWLAGGDPATTVIGEPLEPAERPPDAVIEPDSTGDVGAAVEVSLTVTTSVGEGSYRCELEDPLTEINSLVTAETWSDPENARWMSRTDFGDHIVEQLAFGNPVYPTQTYRRGPLNELSSPCESPDHAAHQIAASTFGGGSSGHVNGEPVLSLSQQEALEGLQIGYRERGIEIGPGVDSLDRAVVVWRWENSGATTSWDDRETTIDNMTEWHVDPDTGRVLETISLYDYGEYGSSRITTTHATATVVTVGDAQFDPVGYDDVTADWANPGGQRHVATRTDDPPTIAVEWTWPAEPVDEEPSELVARFVRELLGIDGAVLGEPRFLYPSIPVTIGELELTVSWWEYAEGLVITDVSSAAINGSDGVNTAISPGAILAVSVPSVASSYTITIAGREGSSTWVVDGIEITDPVASSNTTELPDGTIIVTDVSAQARITIPGMVFADAERVLVIGRDDQGTLLHVAVRSVGSMWLSRAEYPELDD